MNLSVDKYEGCGEQGPLRSIFFAEFHPTAGPIIRCQAPARGHDLVCKDVFDAVSVYIIPKQELARRTITINALQRKICSYPICLTDNKYKRNQFMFNVCFVCFPWSRTVQYEPALIKLSEFLVQLERETEFLSHSEENLPDLQALLEKVFYDLNDKSFSEARVGSSTLKLRVSPALREPIVVHDYDVPVLMIHPSTYRLEWDLTTQQLLPYINGIKHVARVAAEAGVETNLVKAAIQNLIYHRVVKLVPIFQYGNVYCVTPHLRRLRENAKLQKELVDFILLPGRADSPPAFKLVLELVCAFTHGTTVRDLAIRFQPVEKMGVDLCKLVHYLVLKKIVRRIYKYPVYVRPLSSSSVSVEPEVTTPVVASANLGSCVVGAAKNLYELFDGQRHYDDICCRTGLTERQLDDMIDNDPDVFILRR